MNEKKRIDDYLKYYIGCECLVNNGAIDNKTDTLSYLNELGDCGGKQYEWVAKDCTLLLRPLSDMNEEECDKYNSLSATLFSLQNYHNQVRQEAASTHYLLSCGFDLFGLIESGLAIDKTKTI